MKKSFQTVCKLNLFRAVLSVFALMQLAACIFKDGEEKISVLSTGYEYKSEFFVSPQAVANKVALTRHDKLTLVACSDIKPSMIIPLQQILSKTVTSEIVLQRKSCSSNQPS